MLVLASWELNQHQPYSKQNCLKICSLRLTLPELQLATQHTYTHTHWPRASGAAATSPEQRAAASNTGAHEMPLSSWLSAACPAAGRLLAGKPR